MAAASGKAVPPPPGRAGGKRRDGVVSVWAGRSSGPRSSVGSGASGAGLVRSWEGSAVVLPTPQKDRGGLGCGELRYPVGWIAVPREGSRSLGPWWAAAAGEEPAWLGPDAR